MTHIISLSSCFLKRSFILAMGGIFLSSSVFAAVTEQAIKSPFDELSSASAHESGGASMALSRSLMAGRMMPKTVTKTKMQMPYRSDASLFSSSEILPYGYNLFTLGSPKKQPTGVSSDYIISSGDRINLNIWGAVANESILTVDPQGNIFIPEVGPVPVSGVRASELNNLIQSHIREVYQDNVEVYVNLEDRVPVSVFVSGAVKSPGRYAGIAGDSLVDYLTKAGGIDLARGSFRSVKIMRQGQMIENYDLYEFLRIGALPKHTLKEGDVLVVSEKGGSVQVAGEAQQVFAFEFTGDSVHGSDIIRYARPSSDATHANITGFRFGKPFGSYVDLSAFSNNIYHDGDKVFFERGLHADTIKVAISGTHLGAKTMVLSQDTHLKEVLANIPVDPKLSRLDAVYIKRLSVAEKQRQSLQDSVKRLQETLLLARASGNAKAAPVGEGELKLLDKFIDKTESLSPEGRVVVMGNQGIADMTLEDGDEVVIPMYSDLVSINGEVRLPKAIVWNDNDSLSDYISRAGGFTDNANQDDVIVVRANGETELGTGVKIMPGDEVIVMPEVKINSLEIASSVADILYKAVLAVAIPIRLNN